MEQELEVFAGTDFLREYRWLPDAVTPQDFTGWSARMFIGPARGVATLTLTTGAGITLGTDGLITIHLDPIQTDALVAPNLTFVLDLVDPNGFVLRFLRGHIRLVRDVEPT